MLKQFTEKREIDVTVTRAVCDICENIVPEETPLIRLTPILNISSYLTSESLFGTRQQIKFLDICSVDCLVKNIGGISVVLNTKHIPELISTKNTTITNTAIGTTALPVQVLTATSASSVAWVTP